MTDIFRLPFLLQALLACLVLALVLPYFGLFFSYKVDLPTGSTLVATFGLFLLLVFLLQRLVRMAGKGRVTE